MSPASPQARPALKLIRHGGLLAVHARQLEPGAPYHVPSFGVDDAFFVTTHLVPSTSDVWRNGRRLPPLSTREGDVQLFDLRQAWRAVIQPPFETVNLRIPLAVIAEAVDSISGGAFDPPAIVQGRSDPTLLALSRALVPALLGAGELEAVFVQHIVNAAAAHIVGAYRDGREAGPRPAPGLLGWQQRRAVQLLTSRLDRDVPLSEVAAVCGLSPGHFARAFKRSFGLPPHRWLLRERVRRAAALMSETAQPIDQIALACGFVDQSHLSRTFRRVMHLPPAAWRRAQLDAGASPPQG